MSLNTPAAQQLIDGKLVGASDGATYPILNPATGQEIGVAPDGTAADMEAAITAARRAFDESDWSTDRELRVRCIRQLRRERRAALCGQPDLGEQRPYFLDGAKARGKVDVAQNGREHVVEVVGDAARQATDALELLRLL